MQHKIVLCCRDFCCCGNCSLFYSARSGIDKHLVVVIVGRLLHLNNQWYCLWLWTGQCSAVAAACAVVDSGVSMSVPKERHCSRAAQADTLWSVRLLDNRKTARRRLLWLLEHGGNAITGDANKSSFSWPCRANWFLDGGDIMTTR